jgi:glutamate 5-kinase
VREEEAAAAATCREGDNAVLAKSSSQSRNSSFVSLLARCGRATAHVGAKNKSFTTIPCAAAGQFEMMNLYSSLRNLKLVPPQLLVTRKSDFCWRVSTICITLLSGLLDLGIVPIIGRTMPFPGNLGYTTDDVFFDNDSLAAICRRL